MEPRARSRRPLLRAAALTGLVAASVLLPYLPARAQCSTPWPTDLASLDLTVTKRVRGVFLAPSDRPFRDCLHERLDTWIRMAQRFFREEMASRGYLDASGQGKTFRYEIGPDGRWDVVYLVGDRDASWYQSQPGIPGDAAFSEMYQRLPASFHLGNVTVYMYDLAEIDGNQLLYTGQAGSGAPWEGEGAGYVIQGAHFLGVGFDTVAICPGQQSPMFEQSTSSGLLDYDGDRVLHVLTRGQYASTDIGAAIHELGHAFTLGHDFVDHDGDGIETNLMGNGFRRLSGRYTPLGYLPATQLGPPGASGLDGSVLFNQTCSDADGDFVCDADDLCPGFDDRQDLDCDGVGDGCDNCPYTQNPDQADRGGVDQAEGDGIGDSCQNGDFNDDGRVDLLDDVLLRRRLAGVPGSFEPVLPHP